MVCLDMDHPEIVDFINWKVREEKKAHALIAAGYSSDFNGDAYHTDQRPELEQLGPRHRRLHARRVERAASGRRARARPARSSTRYERARTCGARSPRRRGRCADPGRAVRHARSTAGTPARTPGRINASNPCSEYMFLDDTACNLSSLNLTKFLGEDGTFDVEGYRHAVRVFFIAQEILVDFSRYPTQRHRARTGTTTARSASATRTSARC